MRSTMIKFFLMAVMANVALVAWASSGGIGMESQLRGFIERMNVKTGMTTSYLDGTMPITQFGANTYDMALWAMASQYGAKVIATYARNAIEAVGSDQPQTLSRDYTPGSGVLSIIRIDQMDEPGWWSHWEWSVKSGENAWIGLAACREFVDTNDRRMLAFARERGEFLLSLQDKDGGIRMGPVGQYHVGGKDGYWKLKSTENNESALYFLDHLYLLTRSVHYKRAADRIYDWLITKMLDPGTGLFWQGMHLSNGIWRADTTGYFSPDTVSWMPVERMLEDQRLGGTKIERLDALAKMMSRTEQQAGVEDKRGLIGISFSSATQNSGIVSPEWTAQYILLCELMEKTCRNAGDTVKADSFAQKVAALRGYLDLLGAQYQGSLPYAVYSNGSVAQNIDTGHGWKTPESDAALSSTIYYGFAARHKDPLRQSGVL